MRSGFSQSTIGNQPSAIFPHDRGVEEMAEIFAAPLIANDPDLRLLWNMGKHKQFDHVEAVEQKRAQDFRSKFKPSMSRDILRSTDEENANRARIAWEVIIQSQLWSATPALRPAGAQLRAAWHLFDQMRAQGHLHPAFDVDQYHRLRHPRLFPPRTAA